MPRYFFNTRIGAELIRDAEGIDLRDPDHAWQIARATIRDLLQESGQNKSLIASSLEVTDAAGEIVLEFPFSEALLDPSDDPPTSH
jgi:hypothetical protein